MIQSKSFIVGVKVIGTIIAIDAIPVLTSEVTTNNLQLILQIIVALGGLISILKKKEK